MPFFGKLSSFTTPSGAIEGTPAIDEDEDEEEWEDRRIRTQATRKIAAINDLRKVSIVPATDKGVSATRFESRQSMLARIRMICFSAIRMKTDSG